MKNQNVQWRCSTIQLLKTHFKQVDVIDAKKAVVIEEPHNYRKYVDHFNRNHKPDAASAIHFSNNI